MYSMPEHHLARMPPVDPPPLASKPFRCHCGWEHSMRVSVKRAYGSSYVTEFVRCLNCSAMFHMPPQDPTPPNSRSPMTAYMAAATGPFDTGMSPEQLQAIQEAADRARASRSWKPRRR